MAFIVTPGELNRRAELYYQLGSMMSAGVPLIKALEMASGNPALRGSHRTISGLIRHLQSGLTFGESMNRVQGWMPDFDIALLSVGEKSGRLDGSFKLLSTYYGMRAKIIRDTLAGLLVSAATLHVFLLIFPLNLTVACALGIFNGVYSQCLPFVIEKLVVFGGLYAAILLLIYSCQGRRGEGWRAVVETFTQMIPVLRTAQRYLALSRLSAALNASISAGVSILTGWELAAAASGSPRLRRKVASWRPQLESGDTPGEMVNRTSYFPEMFANLYSTGEHSGRIDDAVQRLQVYYQEEGFRRLRTFSAIMNGVIYGLIVLLVAISVIGFYMNYYGEVARTIDGL